MNRRPTTLAFAALMFTSLASLGCDEADASDNPPTPEPAPRIATHMDDYRALCDGAKPFDGMKAVDAGTLKKVVTFVKYADNDKPTWSEHTPEALDAWKPEAAGDVGLVACVERKRLEKANTCRFNSGHVLNYYSTADHIRLIEPSTGNVVAEEKVKIESRSGCPTMHNFRHQTEWEGPRYDTRVMSLAMKVQPADAPMPEPPKAYAMYQVCGGIPFPQIAAYDPTADHYQGIGRSQRGPEPTGDFVGRLGEEGENIRLVACTRSKALKKKRSCAFNGGNTLEIHDGEMEVEIRETRTAKVLATRTFQAKGSVRCPTIHNFAEGDVILGRVDPAFDTFIEGFTGKPPKDDGSSKKTTGARVRR